MTKKDRREGHAAEEAGEWGKRDRIGRADREKYVRIGRETRGDREISWEGVEVGVDLCRYRGGMCEMG